MLILCTHTYISISTIVMHIYTGVEVCVYISFSNIKKISEIYIFICLFAFEIPKFFINYTRRKLFSVISLYRRFFLISIRKIKQGRCTEVVFHAVHSLLNIKMQVNQQVGFFGILETAFLFLFS